MEILEVPTDLDTSKNKISDNCYVKNPEAYYKREGNTYLIEIRLSDIRQLFNSLDPAPFFEKDLNNDAESYIVLSVNEFPIKTPLKLVFYLPQQTEDEAKKILPSAIHNYFNYRKCSTAKELRHTLRQGRISLLIGLVFLAICISISKLISLLGDGTFVNIITEGLLIVGWVAMWRPLEIFLYDWWPIRHTQEIFEKLNLIEIDIRIL